MVSHASLSLPIHATMLALTRSCRSFWQGATVESKTGNFSFWLGKRHVIGISGPAARRLFYDHPDMELVSGATLVPFGPHFMPPVDPIFRDGYHTGRSSSFFLRRLTAMLKTEQLEKHLPDLLRDTRGDITALLASNPSGVTYTPAIWRSVVKHNCRLFFTDEVVEDPEQWQHFVGLMDTALHTASIFNVAFPWLPSPLYIKRRLMRYGLQRLTTKVINKRMKPGAPRRDDPVQMLLDNTDRKEFMVEFFFSTVFISSANTHAVAAQLLNIMAIHLDWQDKIYAEVKQAAETHSKRKHATLVEQLDMMPLSAWESSFPSLDLCMKEVVRMWLSISAARRNIGEDPIPIPGSNEVIPPMTFAIYNTTETHFSDKLYPDPTKFDPERYLKGREEFKQETYGCKY
jgi:Cytochrome P450